MLSIHYTFGELVKFIREAYQKMKTAKKDHLKNRMSYVEELSEARVIHRSPHLLDTNEATPIRQERTIKERKNLLKRE